MPDFGNSIWNPMNWSTEEDMPKYIILAVVVIILLVICVVVAGGGKKDGAAGEGDGIKMNANKNGSQLELNAGNR